MSNNFIIKFLSSLNQKINENFQLFRGFDIKMISLIARTTALKLYQLYQSKINAKVLKLNSIITHNFTSRRNSVKYKKKLHLLNTSLELYLYNIKRITTKK